MIITFQQLGKFGRLGNQMFQVASTIGIAKKFGAEYAFPESKYFKSLPVLPPNLTFNTYHEQHFHYSEPFADGGGNWNIRLQGIGNWNLSGYFQSYKYFDWCWPEMERYFECDPETERRLRTQIKELAGHKMTVAIHVRRGDYLNLQDYHPVQSKEYYIRGMAQFNTTNTHFFVFSDDMNWCVENFSITAPHISFIHQDEKSDLYMGSFCDHLIGSNSSFSWWQGWLNKNPNKRIFLPKNWFGPAYADKSTRDLIPENWIQI